MISGIVLVFPSLTLEKYFLAGVFIMKDQDLVGSLVVSVKLVDTCGALFVLLGERAPEDATSEKELRKSGTVAPKLMS